MLLLHRCYCTWIHSSGISHQPVVVRPNTTVEFTCSVQSNVLTWIIVVPTDINIADSQPLKLSVLSSSTNDIYTASVSEGSNSSYTSSTLTVVVPSDVASNSIACVRGFGNNENDETMYCPLVIESKTDTLYSQHCIDCCQQVYHLHLSTLQ